MPSQPGFNSIIIVGAGPSGLLLALLLAELKPRPQITILDAAPALNESPRATHYGTPAIKLFREARILDEIRRDGFLPKHVCWRKLNGERLTGIDCTLLHGTGSEGDGLTVYWVERLCALLERELKARAGVGVQWGHKVVAIKSGLSSGDPSASIEVEYAGGQTTLTGDYLVGCDGGTSTIRRLLFGRNFPGFSWDVPIVATNTEIDLDRFGWEDSNFIIHPEHWFMAAKIQDHEDPRKAIWRISYGEKPGLSNEELLARQEMKFEQMLPGHPKPGEYRVVNKSPYRVHQRCVEKMRVGRIVLAADAAHLCNPFGGMGLTGGICDVGALAQCLGGIHSGAIDDSILDKYCEVQRRMWHEIINPVSTDNLKRMHLQDPETALEQDEMMVLIKQAETNPQMSREIQEFGDALIYDYTQHFRPAKASKSSGPARL